MASQSIARKFRKYMIALNRSRGMANDQRWWAFIDGEWLNEAISLTSHKITFALI